MKKMWIQSVTFCLLAACFCVLPVEATGNTTGRVPAVTAESPLKEGAYTYSVTDGKATITGCTATVSGNVTIPATLGGYPVETVGNNVFDGNTGLTAVTIPNSVTTIGEYAFRDCSKMRPNSSTLRTIPTDFI